MTTAAEITRALGELDAKYSNLIPQQEAREEELRALAFQREFEIAGVAIRAVTLADFRLLIESGNGLFGGGQERDAFTDCAHFLWAQRIKEAAPKPRRFWRRKQFTERERFNARLLFFDRDKLIRETVEYVESLYLDRIALAQGKGAPSRTVYPWCMEAGTIDQLAGRYGWTSDYILNLPLAQIREFQNIIHFEQTRKKDETPVFDFPSKKLRVAYWAQKNELMGRLNNTRTATEALA